MRNLMILVLGLSILTGCGTIQKGRDIVNFVSAQKKELESLMEKGQAAVDERLDKIDADAARAHEKFASMDIILDANGDGRVEFGEGKAAIIALAKGAITDPEKRDMLLDPDTYKQIGAAILGGSGLATYFSRRRRKNGEIQKGNGVV